MLDQDLGHHRGEPVEGVGGAPIGGRDRLGEREEGPVREAVAVDQEQLAVGLGGLRGLLLPCLRRGHELILWAGLGALFAAYRQEGATAGYARSTRNVCAT